MSYDVLGRSYSATRATDPRIAAAIWDALGEARTVVNVGAGSGSYEPPNRDVTAVEPSVAPVPIPHDCRDGFYGAHWRRPEAYLDPTVRAGISTLAKRSLGELEAGLARLEHDLRTGAWAERHRDVLAREELDLGYRLLVSAAGAAPRGA